MALVLAAMGLATSAYANQTLWTSGDAASVATGGYWFGYTDSNDNGSSTWSCGGTVMANENAKFNPCIADGPVKVTFGLTTDVPPPCEEYCGPFGFAGVGFNLGADNNGVKEEVDLSDYSGISITYKASAPMNFQLVNDEAAVAYDVHTYVLKANASSASLTWDQFKQAGWGTTGVLNTAALTQMKFQAHTDNTGGSATDVTFEISDITLTDGGSGPIPVFGGATGVNFEYNLVGETLVFNGLSEAMNVEVFDLQGKLVANGEVSSSANSISLEGLKNASYVVRTTQGQFLISIAK